MGALQIPPLFHPNDRGEDVWSCLRCGSEFAAVSAEPCHRITVGALVVGASCTGCRDVIAGEIQALCPEPSFQGLPPGENDPGLPDGTPPDVAQRIRATHIRKVQTKR